MLREFLPDNRSELIDRSCAEVAQRPAPRAPPVSLEQRHAGCDFSSDQTVHDCGADEGLPGRSARLAALAHELRNMLNTAIVATAAIKAGSVGLQGATAAALDRSLVGMREVIDRVLTEVRFDGPAARTSTEVIDIGAFLVDVQVDAALAASDKRRELTVLPVEPGILVEADRRVLASAVASLLRNAFEHTRSHTDVVLRAHSSNGRVLFEVEDECGGRPDAEGVGAELLLRCRGIEANGGRIHGRSVDRGCVLTIELPRKG